MTVRTGIGVDTHALAPGRPLILGGVDIPHEEGLAGHSGAAGLGDIGQHFPDTDPRYEGADSMEMLRTVVAFLETNNFTIEHVDSTVMMERPKLAPYRDAMREGLARVLGVALASVNVKATTGERMGFVGRREGVAALAIVTLTLAPP